MSFEVDQPVWVRVEGSWLEGVITKIKPGFIDAYHVKVTDTNKMQVYNVIFPAGLLKDRIHIDHPKGKKDE